MGAMPQFDVASLRRLVGTASRMASDHDGEALTAMRLTLRMLDGRGLRIGDVIEKGVSPPKIRHEIKPPATLTREHQRTAFSCLTRDDLWSDKEADFLEDMMHRRGPATPKQADWLGVLHRRFLRSGGAA